MSRTVLVLTLVSVLLGAGRVHACAWDRDTLATEAAGLPDVMTVMTGRFARQPPAYYEMRLARVAKEIARDGSRLEDYDDAGVAADRLGRGDEAVAWMMRKKAELDRRGGELAALSEHRYRFHANLGTFLAHRWIRNGADRKRLEGLQSAREHIASAIAINPEAHFGRERYQLMAIDWLLAAPAPETVTDATLFWPFRERIGDMPTRKGRLKEAGFGDAIQGLSGLIVLGDAWESVDVFLALGVALESEGHAGLATVARLRIQELRQQGRKSLNPSMSEEVFDLVVERNLGRMHEDKPTTESYYPRARREATEWAERRSAFMTIRLAAGEHPDTHPDFWNGFRDTPAPTPGEGVPLWLLLVAAAAAVFLALESYRRRRYRDRSAAAGTAAVDSGA